MTRRLTRAHLLYSVKEATIPLSEANKKEAIALRSLFLLLPSALRKATVSQEEPKGKHTEPGTTKFRSHIESRMLWILLLSPLYSK